MKLEIWCWKTFTLNICNKGILLNLQVCFEFFCKDFWVVIWLKASEDHQQNKFSLINSSTFTEPLLISSWFSTGILPHVNQISRNELNVIGNPNSSLGMQRVEKLGQTARCRLAARWLQLLMVSLSSWIFTSF